MKTKRVLAAALGFVCLGLGTIGVILPILPTVPFYLAALFLFGKSSQRLEDWFVGTDLYKKHLESYVEKRGMLAKTKFSILSMVTLLMGYGFYKMKNVPVGRIILFIVWAAHMAYFLFAVETVTEEELKALELEEE